MATTTLATPSVLRNAALKINVLSEAGRHLASEPITEADLTALRCEAWFESFLRRGRPGVPLAEAVFRLTPIFKADSDAVCAGFALEAEAPRGGVARCEFSRRALAEVAGRAAERLLKFGVLEPGDKYHFEIVVDGDPPRRSAADAAVGAGKVNTLPLPPTGSSPLTSHPSGEGGAGGRGTRCTIKTPPLHFLSAPLRDLLKGSRAVDPLDEEAFHVFFTEAAFAAAEKFSRQGANAASPIETGAALAGFLCLANDGGENGDVFVVVTDVLEAVNSAGSEFSLTYTSESWSRIGRIMAARQSAQPAFRLCGSAHGHNFSPGEPCAACFKTAGPCGAHNVAPSGADQVWTQSVFAHQPRA